MDRKVFVTVGAQFDTDGVIKPLWFVWDNGRKYKIDKVIDVRKTTSFRVGGAGVRYTCRVWGEYVYLFYDDKKWFMEGKTIS